ncbi:GNAT family N-acetyltransferase [Streptomyces liliifuscus]|uniref:GNAT family N-acetyltransferase n=1 Tax=Streptomyces liliifuscus TaxID=2797636 RepID=A0A7T7L4L2_9ACTN|nr:GNAT family N-acetyltransferase [Streptomyces liliifuscus]QQM46249.1 GNAT family N-acetyltransferase [Streptomyces liliifuscus]
MTIKYEWRGDFGNVALNALHADGFVNVAWDGGVHAFILDTVVAQHHRGRGIGAALVATAAHEARVAKCEWLHVDFEEHLRTFYFDACGFQETTAGLIAL